MLDVIHLYSNNCDLITDQQFNDNTVLWISDTINYSNLDQLIAKFGNPRYIVNDNNFKHHDKSIYSLPLFLEKEIQLFKNLDFNDNIETKSCFNFIINKKTENRNLLLKLVEYFNLSTEYYTYSGLCMNTDMNRVIKELETLKDQNWPPMSTEEYNNFKFILIGSCNIPSNIINFPGQVINQISITRYGGNQWTWLNGLDNIFQNTAVSLISESVEYQKVSCVTEKTGYSVLGLTFPIWVGGYGIADAWADAGLDTFDDIVDHSYQHKNTLIERCYHAVADNIKLLTDLNFVQARRTQCLARLIDNRKKILNGILTDYCYRAIQTWPTDLSSVVNPLIDKVYSKK
jgi:hypothetical protein